MAKKNNHKIDGADKLQNFLNNLPTSLRQKAAREATRRGAEMVFKTAKTNVHRAQKAYKVTLANGDKITRQPGELADAMIMTHIPQAEAPSYLSQHKVTFLKNKHNQIYKIAHLIEYGVSAHAITSKNGKTYQHSGHQAYPFFNTAVKSQKGNIYRVVGDVIKNGIISDWKGKK
ncbi:hypothetical protein QG087_09225 [Kingella kingae]|uniref:hypothetical protein n=1 Tax=Kingella kingae TaxID=504 RepID=UPI00254ADAF0|nr:hypothetical protein [Kingella kingae]MDK4586938.1 hypothetical protein [Kingella kingae]MDK4644461.1 hypothetical protein [Kingella kingae]MDK4657133.1 hypothetical protein [Kingella kingae]MDK4670463.1 hypothetical protein [Kingella kingae]